MLLYELMWDKKLTKKIPQSLTGYYTHCKYRRRISAAHNLKATVFFLKINIVSTYYFATQN